MFPINMVELSRAIDARIIYESKDTVIMKKVIEEKQGKNYFSAIRFKTDGEEVYPEKAFRHGMSDSSYNETDLKKELLGWIEAYEKRIHKYRELFNTICLKTFLS